MARIKNWEQFQHYKTGKNAAKRPEWIKFYTRLIDDIEFHELDGKDAKVLVLLWALASEYGGDLPPVKTIAFRLRLSESEINKILGRLIHWLEPMSYDNPRTEEEEEEEKKEKKNKNENETRAHAREFAETFWPSYPNKAGKPKAFQAFLIKRRQHSLNAIMQGLERYLIAKPPDRQWLNPTTFLNQERFLDEPATVATSPPSRTMRAAEKLIRSIENGHGTSGNGVCGQDRGDASRQLPKPTARPGHVFGSTDDRVNWEAQETVAEDDSPGGRFPGG